jgi:hypothetical protein
MALLPTTIVDYTDKDFDALRFRLRNLIRSVFPEWTDFNVANFGNLLIELFAHVGDVLTFYQDTMARQARISTATQRRALLGLVKLIGYTPLSATPATVDVTISLAASPVGSVTFPAGTFVRTQEITDPISYQLLADAVIPAGASPATVTVAAENSETHDEVFSTNGLANQQFTLARSPYIDASAIVTAGNGLYSQVENFLSSTPSDTHYTVTVDQADKATIRFGNAINGAIPVGNVFVEYKTGGGSAGRVEANKLVVLEGAWSDSFGNAIIPTVTNPLASSGGADRQSVAQIKERAPATIRAISRSVTRDDFAINARRVADVARAIMVTRNEDPGVPENAGFLYVVPVGGGTASSTLLSQVETMVTVTYPATLTFSVTVATAIYKTIDVFAVVYIKQGQNKPSVAQAIRDALDEFFAVQNADGTDNANVDFGGNILDSEGNVISELALSDIFNVVRDVSGVRKVGAGATDFLLNEARDDVALATREFPVLGTVTLRDGDTGGAL